MSESLSPLRGNACHGSTSVMNGYGVHAQAVQYSRPRLAEHIASTSLTRVAISTAEAEAADQLATWTVATLCRSLSLPNILTVLTGAHQRQRGSATRDARDRHSGKRAAAVLKSRPWLGIGCCAHGIIDALWGSVSQ